MGGGFSFIKIFNNIKLSRGECICLWFYVIVLKKNFYDVCMIYCEKVFLICLNKVYC